MKLLSSFYESIRNSEHIGDIASEFGEVAMDTLLSDGPLKEIPVLSTVLSILKAGNDIQAYFLAKKIVRFLKEIENTTKEERLSFIEKYSQEKNIIDEDVGEMTLMLLEKTDSSILSSLLGKALFLLIKEKIDKNLFEIYSYIIKDLNPYLIRQLKQFYGYGDLSIIDAPAAIQLSNYGLVEVITNFVLSGSNNDGMNRSYNQTGFGRKFYERIIKDVA